MILISFTLYYIQLRMLNFYGGRGPDMRAGGRITQIPQLNICITLSISKFTELYLFA